MIIHSGVCNRHEWKYIVCSQLAYRGRWPRPTCPDTVDYGKACSYRWLWKKYQVYHPDFLWTKNPLYIENIQLDNTFFLNGYSIKKWGRWGVGFSRPPYHFIGRKILVDNIVKIIFEMLYDFTQLDL